MVTVTLTPEDVQELRAALDFVVRANGLAVARTAMALDAKLADAKPVEDAPADAPDAPAPDAA